MKKTTGVEDKVIYSCPHKNCDKFFDFPSDLSIHLRTHTEERKYFYCDWPGCEKKFTKRYNLKRHTLQLHSENRERSFSCVSPGCTARFFEKSTAKTHLFKHTGTRRFSCAWPNCDKKFFEKINLKKHILSIHEIPKNYVCDICGYNSYKKFQITTHITHFHNDSAKRKKMVESKRLYICHYENCAKNCLRPSNLKNHLMSHTEERPYSCEWPNCEKKFRDISSLSRHQKNHIGEHLHNCKCQNCKKKFELKSNLKRQITMLERSHACDWHGCDKKYAHLTTLKMHQLLMHGSVQNLFCDHCKYKCKDKSLLIKHSLEAHANRTNQQVDIFSGGKKLECQCPNCQSVKSGGPRIVDTSGQRLHNCHYENCDKAYNRPYKLAKHLNTHIEKFSNENSQKLVPILPEQNSGVRDEVSFSNYLLKKEE